MQAFPIDPFWVTINLGGIWSNDMVLNSKLMTAAAFALMAITSAHADDASPAPDQHAINQVSSGTVSAQSDPIARAAAFYGTYQKDVGELHAKGLHSTNDVDTVLNKLGGQNPAQLSRGWLAYSAMVASQSPQLRSSVREVVAAYGRDGISRGMLADKGYVRRVLTGGNEAVSLGLAATAADSARLNRSASYFREQAYSLQGTGWAKTKLRSNQMNSKVDGMIASSRSQRAARGNIVTAFASPNIDNALQKAGNSGAPSLWDGVIDTASGIRFPGLGNTSFSSRRRTVRRGHEHAADQIATLAAFRIMGVDSSNAAQVQQALGEGPIRSCISTAQLNTNQCVAANSFPFETVDCIGKHAIGEVGLCFSQTSN